MSRSLDSILWGLMRGAKRPKNSHKSLQTETYQSTVAEAQGLEPWVRSHVRRFSKPVHSTTLPNLSN